MRPALRDGVKLGGWFKIERHHTVLGDLQLDGPRTELHLHDDKPFDLEAESTLDIHGMLHDRTAVTLIDCVARSRFGYANYGDNAFHFASAFPHFVVRGRRQLEARTPSIEGVSFRIDDAELIFYDVQAFGQVVDARKIIDTVIQARSNINEDEIEIGRYPRVCYYTGKSEIARSDTSLGVVTIRHHAAPNLMFTPKGVGINSQIVVHFDFESCQTFDNTIRRVLMLLRFLEMLAGRPQNLEWLSLHLSGEDQDTNLEVYWCHRPERAAHGERPTPHPADLPINAVKFKTDFSSILEWWLETDQARADARSRFYSSFAMQSSYSIDRLIAAANMFDLLPSDALPYKRKLPDDIAYARRVAQKEFKSLPKSDHRDAILGALGRLDQSTLRQKILYRAEIVTNAMSDPPADVEFVVREAVKARNHFVHGSKWNLDNTRQARVIPFLTRALEFIFAASEILDGGWRIREWEQRRSGVGHPFAETLFSWRECVAEIADAKTGSEP
ncbi:MAG: HEPN domain-containing protein [Alphaproteobacteria bacterium]